MEVKDLKKLSAEPLEKMLIEKQATLRDLRSSVASNQLLNVRGIRKVRKDISQIKTILTEQKKVQETVSE